MSVLSDDSSVVISLDGCCHHLLAVLTGRGVQRSLALVSISMHEAVPILGNVNARSRGRRSNKRQSMGKIEVAVHEVSGLC